LGRNDQLLNEPLFDKNELSKYRKIMKLEEEKKILGEIRKQTRLGKPLGDGGFLETLSDRIGFNLSFKSRGRPRKKN